MTGRIVNRTTPGLRRPTPTIATYWDEHWNPIAQRPLVCGNGDIVDYPGPDALDHYANGGVIRVPRTPGPVVRTSATARHRLDIGAWL